MTPGFVILISVAIFAVLLLFLKWYLDRVWQAAGRGIELRHRTAYRILQTQKVPAVWMKRLIRRGALETPRGQMQAKRRALRMIDGYIRYFDTAAPFEDEHAKRVFMSGIRRVRDAWAKTPADSFGDVIETGDSSYGMYRSD